MANEALEAALAEYAAVGKRYVRALEEKGLVFAEAGAGAARCAELRAELAARGVAVRNAGASLSVGHLSPACVECTGAGGSETFSTTFRCHRDCYFCFNHNQPDYDKFFREGCPWEEGLERSAAENESLACVGLTGGEPLLDLDNALALLRRAGELWPGAHKRMYTSGDLLTEASAAALRAAGLDEIRFSVKDDDAPDQQERVLAAMEVAKRFIPSVMVEMPVIPGAGEHMRTLLRRFDALGIDGINLLEFCFPFCNWDEFARRGFRLKNPPFDVMYDYGYSGGLAVAGSEELILELMLWALDEGLELGMHYCSLDNKHRSEMRQKNERAAHAHPCIAFDEGDFFLKTGKVFGPDVAAARPVLEAAGCCDFMEDAEERSLAFPPRYVGTLAGAVREGGEPVQPALCYLVYECEEGESYLIDVALEVVEAA
ncbi:MAG: radical SAM protein [Eggerthellaceae bacterium]|nr:radical SAM protein [Eggerthellaceae bacterium]